MSIAGYRIERELGRTNHSIIYAARPNKNEEGFLNYIIKLYGEGISGKDAASNAIKEIRITQLLENHSPFSVSIPILKQLPSEGKICLLMQQKKSGKFLNEIYDGSIKHNIVEVLETTERILFSLDVLHNFIWEKEKDRILHLDLHPGNIFIENYEPGMSGNVKFIDFANAFEEKIEDCGYDINPFPTGFSDFSAPELVENDIEKLCEGTDLYSVASIMFWMMTGKYFRTELVIEDEIEAYGEKEKLPSILRSAFVQFFQCGFEYNTMYRFSTASDMKKAVMRLKELAEAVKNYDYSHVISLSYEMMIPLSAALRVPMEYNEKEFSRATEILDKNMMAYLIDVHRRKYEYDYYWTIVKNRDSVDKAIMLRMIRSGIIVCNYAPDIAMSEELCGKYEEYKRDIPVMEELTLSAILAEQEVDRYKYEDALNRNINSIKNMELIGEAYRRIALNENKSNAAAGYSDLSCTYSAAGRCLAFLANQYTDEETRKAKQNRALQYFKKAIDGFRNDTDNKKITLCHLLHLAIDMDDKELFERYAQEYYESCSVHDWFDEHVENSMYDLFELYLCLRSLYYLYPEKKGNDMSRKITRLMDCLTRSHYNFPIELIYKYIGLLLFRNSNKVTGEVHKAFQYAIRSTGISSSDQNASLNIKEVMAYQIKAVYNEICGRESDTEEMRKHLIERCQTYGWIELYNRLNDGLPMTKLLSYEYS